jgi:hypothetical protein
MRVSAALVLLAVTATTALARPARRDLSCPEADDNGNALSSTSDVTDDGLITCTYDETGPCTYFADVCFSITKLKM